MIKARICEAAAWSALTEAQFYAPQGYSALQITEIHYNPPKVEGTDGERFEFFELQNRSPVALDFSGLSFASGVDFRFPNNSSLAPNAFFLVVNSRSNFVRRWSTIPVHGEYAGKLDSGGEALVLARSLGFSIFSIEFDDAGGWPGAADGPGASLQRADSSVEPGNPAGWIASVPSPGAPFSANADSDLDGLPDVWEVAQGTDPLSPDAEADPDGDGASNAHEYAAGTNPRDSDGAMRISWIHSPNPGVVELRFTASANRSYSIQWRRALDMVPWVNLLDISPEPADHPVSFLHHDPNETTRFYRLVTPAQAQDNDNRE